MKEKTMFSYSPTERDRSGEIIGAGMIGASETQANTMNQLGSNIGGALASIGGMYAENMALNAKAKGYDQVGKILGDSMFKNNPAVSAYLTELRGVKNPMERISGYEALFGMTGPISNAMNTQTRSAIQQAAPFTTAGINNANTRAEEGPVFRGTRLPGF